jgi:hypothetical protein
MSNEWKEAVEGQNHKVYQDYIAAKAVGGCAAISDARLLD